MNSKHNWNYFFLSAFLLNLAIIEVSFPSLGIRGELFAEVGTNFLYHARYSNLWENILKTDTGYLPLFPRIIAVFVHAFFPEYWFPFIVNQTTFVVVSLAGALLNLDRFKTVFNHRWATWFFSVLYCFHHDYDQFALVNISYAFVPAVFFVFARALLKSTDSLDGLGLAIIGLAFLSKAAYLSFFPALVATLLLGFKTKSRNLTLLSIFGIAFLLIQGVMLKLHMQEGPKSQATPMVEVLVGGIAYCASILNQTFFPIIKGALTLNAGLSILAIGVIVFIILQSRREQASEFQVALFSSIVLIGAALVLSKSFGIKFEDNLFGFASTRFLWDRGKLISHYASFFLVVYLVVNSVKLKKYLRYVLPYVFIINFSTLGNRIFFDRDPFKTDAQSYSHWKRDYNLTLKKEFCVPINPKGWEFCHPDKIQPGQMILKQ